MWEEQRSMTLLELIKAKTPQSNLWDGAYKIPWDEPGFSKRMLELHLAQDHDWASRPFETIDEHVRYIHETLAGRQPCRILDLGCGPGLYAQRLAALGHECVGIDFSPASIAYAKTSNPLPDRCRFELGDLRMAEFGSGYDITLMIYGEFNAFSLDEIRGIMTKACAALKPGGRILIEAHTPEEIERIGRTAKSWYTAESGLFSEQPHVCLIENTWHEAERTAESRFYVIDGATGGVTMYRNTLLQHTLDGYRELLTEAGFSEVAVTSAWLDGLPEAEDQLLLVAGRK